MLRLNNQWLVPVSLSVLSLGTSATSVMAQTTIPFSGNYNVVSTYNFLSPPTSQPLFVQSFPSLTSTDASYGLNKISGGIYGKLDGYNHIFSTDPTVVGLSGYPSNPLVIEGSGSDKLFVTDISTSTVDPSTLKVTANGTMTIIGGEGKYQGATGELNFLEIGTFVTDPSAPYTAVSSINGNIVLQAVPEPRTGTPVMTMILIGTGVLLRKRSRRKISL